MFTLGAISVSAQTSEFDIRQEGFYPNYLAIKNTSIYLSINTSGKAACLASFSTWGGYCYRPGNNYFNTIRNNFK